MINVVLKGVDEFLGAHVETILSPSIAKLYEVSNDEVIFTCYHSIIYHGGMDQTSYHMMITIEANKKFKNKEEEVAAYILKASKAFSVHAHLNFAYFDNEEYNRIEKDYPLFVTKSNEEEINEKEEEEFVDDEEEIYTGNMFENFDQMLEKSNRK